MKTFFYSLTICFCLHLLSINISAQTTIPGGEVSGTWIKANSPYQIGGDITVPPGESLTIEPGARIEFFPSNTMVIQGSLKAEGLSNDSIVFTVPDADQILDPEAFEERWGGLRIIHIETDPDSSLISYCKFEFSRAESIQNNMDNGGAVTVEGFDKVRISNCLFENNTANGGDMSQGGALSIGFSDCRILNNTFRKNSASEGGAVSIVESSPVFIGNVVENNEATYGGGYFIVGCDLNIIGDTFQENSVLANAGAIFIAEWGDRSKIHLNEVSFYNNYALLNGGAIDIGNGELRCYKCLFEGNYCDWIGGAFNVFNNSFLDLTECDLNNNKAPVFGGVMGSYNSFIEIEGCTMNDNVAGVLGGAIHSDWSQLGIRNSVFERDSSGETGGAFWLWHCDAEFDNCDFNDNKGRINSGAIGSDSTNIQISNTSFTANISIWGGAVGFNRGELNINGCSFDDNISEHGGALQAYGSQSYLTNNIFDNNSSIWGGAIEMNHSSLEVDNCSFTGNSASDYGGALVYTAGPSDIPGTKHIKITTSEFLQNYAQNKYGGVSIEQMEVDSVIGKVEIDGCKFINNESGSRASLQISGLIQDITVSNTIFNGNVSNSNTSIFGILNNSKGKVYNCVFSNNRPRAALVHSGSRVSYTNCTFVNTSGSAFDIRRGGTARVLNSIFWDNGRTANVITAADLGSHIYFDYCDVQYGIDSIFPSDSMSAYYWGDGNIQTDPRFVDILADDYRLDWPSPCLEAGIAYIELDGEIIEAPSTDLAGNQRPSPSGTNPDMGAYESSVLAGVDDEMALPLQELLMQNVPNPFNKSTIISWYQPQSDNVKIDVIDIFGKQVSVLLDRQMPEGKNQLEFEASGLTPGIYFYRMFYRNSHIVKMMNISNH